MPRKYKIIRDVVMVLAGLLVSYKLLFWWVIDGGRFTQGENNLAALFVMMYGVGLCVVVGLWGVFMIPYNKCRVKSTLILPLSLIMIPMVLVALGSINSWPMLIGLAYPMVLTVKCLVESEPESGDRVRAGGASVPSRIRMDSRAESGVPIPSSENGYQWPDEEAGQDEAVQKDES